MPFFRAGDLFIHLHKQSKSSFTDKKVKFFVAQMVLALKQLHSLNIVHRDMKPENIFMGEDGYISVADYGLSK